MDVFSRAILARDVLPHCFEKICETEGVTSILLDARVSQTGA